MLIDDKWKKLVWFGFHVLLGQLQCCLALIFQVSRTLLEELVLIFQGISSDDLWRPNILVQYLSKHSAGVRSEWFDKYENNAICMQWLSQGAMEKRSIKVMIQNNLVFIYSDPFL